MESGILTDRSVLLTSVDKKCVPCQRIFCNGHTITPIKNTRVGEDWDINIAQNSREIGIFKICIVERLEQLLYQYKIAVQDLLPHDSETRMFIFFPS